MSNPKWEDIKDKVEYALRRTYGPGANSLMHSLDSIQQPRVTFSLSTMKTSCGADYFVRMECEGRTCELFKSRERYQMEYELAHMIWMVVGGEKPDLMAYNEKSHPNFWPNTHPADTGEYQ